MALKLLMPQKETDWAQLEQAHRSAFDTLHDRCRRWFVPYRLRPLGAHLDHQLGKVASIASDFGIAFIYSPNATQVIRIRSEGFEGILKVFPQSVDEPHGDWGDYLRGALKYIGYPETADGLDISISGILGEVGLSSSAAVTLGYLSILNSHLGLTMTIEEQMACAQRVENEFLGVQSGIGDQSAIGYAKQKSLIEYDCRTAEVKQHRAGADFQFLVVYSGYRQALTEDRKFNDRVSECLSAARDLAIALGQSVAPQGSSVLGDFSAAAFDQVQAKLSDLSRRRARHFYEEMARIDEGCQAWQAGHLARFGQLITESGISSEKNYETGTEALVSLSAFLVTLSGVFGARFSGAGSRGCVLALIDPGALSGLLSALSVYFDTLETSPPESPWAFVTGSGPGARMP